MAVEIPVVVDIEKAFDEAAKRVKTAIKPLQQAIDDNTANLKLKYGEEYDESTDRMVAKTATLNELINGVVTNSRKGTIKIAHDIDDLSVALDGAKERLRKINALQSLGYSVNPDTEKGLREAISVLSITIEQRKHEGEIIQQNTLKQVAAARAIEAGNYALIQEANTMAQIGDKISSLRGKLQNLSPKDKEWAATAREIAKATEELDKFEKKMITATTKPGSINRLNAEMQALVNKWNAMSKAQKFDENGKLKASAQKMIDKFRELTLESERFGKSLQDMARGGAIDQTNSKLDKTNSKLAQIVKNSLRLFALHSAGRFLRQIRDVTAEFELQRVALGSIIQDTERASSLFRQIKAAAVESPFEIKDLVTYTKQLSAYQIETDKLFDTTMKLADVSAGLGVDMSRLILAYGQVRAASVLRGQELRQFTEAGIPLVEKLAEKFTELNGRTVTTAEVFELISKRAVPFRMIDDIFNDMTSAGGMFYKMQEKQAETLQGQWNNLKDAVSIMYDEIGRTKPVHKAMTTLISDAREMMLHWREVAKVLGIVGGALFAHVAISKTVVLWDKLVAAAEAAATAAESTREAGIRRLTARIIGKTAAEKIATKATKIHAAATAAADAVSNRFIKTLWRLVAALANNPFGVLAIGVAALVGSLTTLIGKSESVEERIGRANKSIQSFTKEMEYNSLIEQYELLSKKTNLSAKETAKLRDISRELGKAFPLTTKAIDDQTGALILDIEQLKNYSKEAQETIKESMRAQITANEGQIARYQKRQEHIRKVLERGYGFVEGSYYFGLSKDAKNAEVLREKLIGAADATRELTQTNQELQDAIDGVKRTTDDNREPYPPIPGGEKMDRLRKQISDITDAYKKFVDLRKYLSKDASLRNVATFFPSLEGWEPTYENTIDRLTDMLGSYKGNADATRLLEQAIANIKFEKVKKDMDDALKRVSDDLRRSETARNFYDNILGLTGDRDLAANLTMSVYNTEGDNFAERMRKELVDSLSSLDAESFASLDDSIRNAFDTGDYQYLMKNIYEVPEKLRDVVKQVASDSEKYNADWFQDFYRTYTKAKTYEERIATLQAQRTEKIAEAQGKKMSQSDVDAIDAYYAKEIAEVELEALKDTYTWTKAFEDLEGVSTQTLQNLIRLIDEYIQKNRKNLTPAQLRELTRSRENAAAQIRSRNAYLAAWDALKKLNKAAALKRSWDIAGLKSTEEYAEVLDDETKAIYNLQQALDEIKGQFDDVSSSAKELASVFATDEDAAYFGEQMDNISKTMGGLGKAATGIASIFMGNVTPKTIIQTITGLAEAVAGIFGSKNAKRQRDANREIKEQDELLENLQYQYGRLENAIANAFGSDYITNYNQQLDNLIAKQEAYIKQADAERSKGKKADAAKIKEYENSARAAADQIADMKNQLSEFFAGTDITSAAKDFATAWIDAYREFGSVTDAMGEKFQDMLQSMVEQSLAANVMKTILNPIFKQIDEMAKTDDELSALEIASIAKDAPVYIQRINDAMGVLMNELASAGYNIRRQPGQFTGITRNIANATEDTMSGVAVGINTQNMYMMGIRQDVAQILAIMSGGAQADVSPATNVVLNNELALQYMSALPSIDANIAEMLRTFKSVVSPKSAATNTHYIAVRD